VLGEGGGREPFEDRIALLAQRCIGEDEPLGLHDLAKDTSCRIFDPIGRALDNPKGAAQSQVHFAYRVSEVLRTPPLRHMLRIGRIVADKHICESADSGAEAFQVCRCPCGDLLKDKIDRVADPEGRDVAPDFVMMVRGSFHHWWVPLGFLFTGTGDLQVIRVLVNVGA
jgi:hypothetical protein